MSRQGQARTCSAPADRTREVSCIVPLFSLWPSPQVCVPCVRATSMPAPVAERMLWLLAVRHSSGAGLEKALREFSFWRLRCLCKQQSFPVATVSPSTWVLVQVQRRQAKCSIPRKAHTDCRKLDELATCENVHCCQKAARDAEHSGQRPLARHPCGLEGDLHFATPMRLLHACEDPQRLGR